MKKLIEGLAAQLEDALQISENTSLSNIDTEIRNVVVSGLGGSGIGASILQTVVNNTCKVPVVINKTYNNPAFVNEHTLHIACSFSGNTEEAVSSVNETIGNNPTIIVTSGGELEQIAKNNNLDLILIPGESKCPRANLGYSLVLLLTAMNQAGLIDDGFKQEIKNSVQRIREQQNEMIAEAKNIASQMHNKYPILYSGKALQSLTVRFQQQINENSKQLCHVNVIPEMTHNELVGWENPSALFEIAQVFYIHSSFDHERVTKRMEICRPVFEKQTSPITDIYAKGDSLLEEIFYLIHLTDWVSFYLAEHNGVDPFPVNVINYLKSELLK